MYQQTGMEQSVSEKLKACFSFPLDWLARLGVGVGGTGHLERVLELDSVISQIRLGNLGAADLLMQDVSEDVSKGCSPL